MTYFTFFFHAKSSNSGIHFILTEYLNSDGKFSQKILDLNLDYIKFTCEKVNIYPSSFKYM